MYRSAAHLPEFYERSRSAALQITDDYEFIFVNDGSPDHSLQVARGFIADDPRVKVVDFSRNFGHHKAMMTGLMYGSGDLIFLIDCDLEEPPEILIEFFERLEQDEEADVVFGVQTRRKGGRFERITGDWHYRIINFFWERPLTPNLVTARLMTHRYVQQLIQHTESEIVMSGLWMNTGFKQLTHPVVKGNKGSSSYSFRKKVSLLIRTITAFSNRPLIYIAALGVLTLAVAFVFIVRALIFWLISGTVPEGYTSLLISIWLVGGLIIFSLGIVSMYISVIFNETKNRPYTVVRHVYTADDPLPERYPRPAGRRVEARHEEPRKELQP